jgi:uncharacterized protein
VKKSWIIVMALLALSVPAFATPKEDAANELVRLTDIRQMTDQVIVQVMHMQAEQLKSVVIPKEHQAEEAAIREKIRLKLTEAVGWEKLESEYTKFLSETYTDEELKAVLTFYKSSAGRSILQKEPVIMGKIMVLIQSRIQTVYPEIQKMTRDFTESVKRIR